MTIKEKISESFNEWKQKILTNYNSFGLRASGNFEQELEVNIKEEPTKYTAKLLGASYTDVLDKGRGMTKQSGGGTRTLREIIREWIDQKPVIPRDNISKESLAFLISRKIHREGIRVPNQYNPGGLVSNVITGEEINKLANGVNAIYTTTIKSDILKQFKDGSN